MNIPPPSRNATSKTQDKLRRGLRWSLTSRISLMVILLVAASIAAIKLLDIFFPQQFVLACIVSGIAAVPMIMAIVRHQLRHILELFRAMAGTVISYKDRDFSFGLHWKYNDELADLVDAHNDLGHVLREQRLDLVQRELLLDSMLQNTPVAMLLTAERGHIVFSNITARQLLNEGRRLEGQHLNQVLEHVSSSLREAMKQGGDGLFTVTTKNEPALHAEQTQTTDDSEDEIYHLSCRSFTLNGTRHELFLIRHLTIELRRQEVQTWKKVIRVISHELNNSLAPVASLAHSAAALIERGQYERLPEILHTIEERANHLESFIHGYARFAKLPTPRVEKVDWVSFMSRLQSQINFSMIGNLPEESVHFDMAQMEQAMLNLLKNAIESDSPAQAVCVEVRRMHEAYRIEVSDQGSGMSDAVMSNALVPFYSTKRNGTGLGLALTREIIEAHGGRIMLNNREGGGLVVSLILPI